MASLFLPFFIITGFLIATAVALVLWISRHQQKRRTLAALHQVLLLVTIPQRRNLDQVAEPKPSREYIAVADQFFSSLTTILSQAQKQNWPALTLETAVHLLDEEIHFYIAVPEQLVDQFVREINAFYPDAHIEPAEDYNIFHPQGKTAGSYLRLEKDSILPLKTYKVLEIDILLSFSNALAKLAKEGEGAAIQILIRPGSGSASERTTKVAKKLSEGAPLSEALKAEGETTASKTFSFAGSLAKDVWETQKQSQAQQQREKFQEPPKQAGPAEQQLAQALQEKASQQNFSVNVRLVTSAPTQDRAEMILAGLESPFAQLSNPGINSIKPKRVTGHSLKKFVYNFSFRIFDSSQQLALSSAELASLWHFPPPQLAAPKIKWLKARSSEPPPNLPEEGLILGENEYRGQKRLVRISSEDRRRHFYIIGQTGTGKSTLMHEMIRQDIEEGRGVAVIDPHGSLVEPLLGIIPKNRAEDVIYFNPAMTERTLGLNMLEWDSEEQKDFAVSEMIAIFMKLFPPEYIGPMFEHDMRNAMLTIMADRENPGTIVEIPRIFTDKEFVKLKLKKVIDPIVRAYWEKEAAQTTEFHKSEKLGYLISKLGRFLENSMMRNILGQSRSSFNFREIMDTRKILLVNLSKGKVGEMNSYLLGLIIVSKLLIAAFSRADISEGLRQDFYLYMDEFQTFTTDTIASILAEARKYRLNLTIAHQFIGQLPSNIRDAVFGNVGSITAFRVGPDDAQFLEKQFAPVFSANDLVNIENFNAYVKLLIAGYPSRPFNIKTSPPKEGSEQWAEQVRALSIMKYGRPRQMVEQEIYQKLQSVLAAPVTTPAVPSEVR